MAPKKSEKKTPSKQSVKKFTAKKDTPCVEIESQQPVEIESQQPVEMATINSPTVESPTSDSINEEVNETPTLSKVVSSSEISEKIEQTEINHSSKFLELLNNYTERVANVTKELRELASIGKSLEKEFNYVVKQISKQKKNRRSENRPLSGFAMPSLLTDELYTFLKIKPGTLVPRKDVTRMINEYITSNSLRDEADKRRIMPNEELKQIFKSDGSEQITYFNLQTYMKHHFIKSTIQVIA